MHVTFRHSVRLTSMGGKNKQSSSENGRSVVGTKRISVVPSQEVCRAHEQVGCFV